MSIFSEAWKAAFLTGDYVCPKCGGKMYFEDDNEETLICSDCGFDEDIDHYGFTDEEYETEYPLLERPDDEESDEDENRCGETYDEVCGELDLD